MRQLVRIGTIYIPVRDVQRACIWYKEKLNANVNYKDEDKAILDLANQSFFLVGALDEESSNFFDKYENKKFSITFEVDGLVALKELREDLVQKGVEAGEIESRGHNGRNFVFSDGDGNLFDVWSELSPQFKEAFNL
ncbi:MAG: VOC family protein [Bacillota bacterium]